MYGTITYGNMHARAQRQRKYSNYKNISVLLVCRFRLCCGIVVRGGSSGEIERRVWEMNMWRMCERRSHCANALKYARVGCASTPGRWCEVGRGDCRHITCARSWYNLWVLIPTPVSVGRGSSLCNVLRILGVSMQTRRNFK